MILNKRFILYVFSMVILVVVYGGIHIIFRNFPLVWDEVYHTRQLTKFLEGTFTLDSGLSMLPGYHVLLTGVLYFTGLRDVASFRLFNLLVSFILIGVVYRLNDRLLLYRRILATGQFVFFPLFFMFHFLVYSDMMSLLSICIVYLLLSKRHRTASGVFAVLSVFIRQTNIVWVGFFFVLDYAEQYGVSISTTKILEHCKKLALYILSAGLFLVFVFINHGVSLAGKDMQPIGVVSLGNITFLLFLLFFVLLPLHVYNFRIIAGLGKKILLIAAIMLGYFVIGMITFSNTHPWNQYPIFIRNVILTTVVQQSMAKIIYFLLGSITLCSLLVTKLSGQRTQLFYTAAFLSLLPYWLVEPRYAFVPLGLFLLWRVPQTLWIEHTLLIWFIIVSFLSMWGLFQYTLYL